MVGEGEAQDNPPPSPQNCRTNVATTLAIAMAANYAPVVQFGKSSGGRKLNKGPLAPGCGTIDQSIASAIAWSEA